MINVLLAIIKMLIVSLPFIFLCLSGKKINLEKPYRSRQFLMVPAAVLFTVVIMFLLTPINNIILNFLYSLPDWIMVLTAIIPFDTVNSYIIKATEYLRSLLDRFNFNFWIFFITNGFLIIVYQCFKRICLGIIKKVTSGESGFFVSFAENFYEYFPERDKWCVREDYVYVRSMFRMMYNCAIVMSTLLMLLSRKFYYANLIRTVFYPVFGVIIIGELYFYLDGYTRREYTEDILGEDENAYRTVNYSLLRKFLRNLFRDKLLSENTSINNGIFNSVTNDEIIHSIESREDRRDVVFASFIKSLNEKGFDLDYNYVYSALDLLHGRSILFNNPFYKDLIPYVFYPMNRSLLSHKKVLVVLGRHAVEQDIIKWLEKGIESITSIPFMWNIGILDSKEKKDLDIGIITRSDVLNISLYNANNDFFENVEYFVIIEPSRLISTAQIGLNLIVKKCRGDEEKHITYCLCDKNCDGLVDAMSHILMTSITEVSATPRPLGTASYMCWDADNEYLHHRIVPNISRYLGLGTELSFAALKNQVSSVKWYGGEVFPVTDIRWIDKQYYYDLMKYASLPTNQEEMNMRFHTSANFWSAGVEKYNYITVEDEPCNMFEILRNFSTRFTEQGFINIISSDYLLKDYMADNAPIFETDAKAIPQIVADYIRSERNTALRLILMMSAVPLNINTLKKELSLLGIKTYCLKKQLWYEIFKCYADTKCLSELPEDYREAVESVSHMELPSFTDIDGININIIKEKDSFNVKLGRIEHVYYIDNEAFLARCVSELKSAGYVAEDERGEKYYFGSELRGHIYQKYLPGQFFVFDGKYYEIEYLNADGQVMVKRAADHITGRPAYRQIRKYGIDGMRRSDRIGSGKDISGMKIIREYADICVDTLGYYRMQRYNDFATAKKIMFSEDKNGIPQRTYHNKELLKIELPEKMLTDKVRYTITLLFNEVFRTLFAENQPYIAAVTDTSFMEDKEEDSPLTYTIGTDMADKNSIYIIEDSQLDLGLIEAVERNLGRIFEIVHDYMDWHIEALEKSLDPPAEPVAPIIFTEPEGPIGEEEKLGFFARLKKKILSILNKINIFKKKKKNGEDAGNGDNVTEEDITQPKNTVADEEAAATAEKEPEENTAAEEIPEETAEEIPDKTPGPSEEEISPDMEEKGDEEVSEEDKPDTTQAPAEEEITSTVNNRTDVDIDFDRLPYHSRYYILYGNSTEPSNIDVASALDYLSALGFGRNPLRQARDGKNIADKIAAAFKPAKANSRYCDFCGAEIFGVEFETLSDGRDRCINCGRTAIKTGEEFRKIFEDVRRNMESFFGIKINTGIKVEMVNSKTLHKKLGKTFLPTPSSDGRILGVAINDKDGYTLIIENGSPRMASMLTMAHELTHIWQYLNWNDKDIISKYGKLRLEIYEGMAKWVEIQYAYLINEPATAKREELITAFRNDEYGRGFLRYMANYPFSQGTVITRPTPFMNIEQPLEFCYCGQVRYTGALPPQQENEDKGSAENKEYKLPDTVKGLSERDVRSFRRYAYDNLDEKEKATYDSILAAINGFNREIKNFGSVLTKDKVEKIISYIDADHPELFWFRKGAVYYFDKNTKEVSKIELTYCMTKEEADKRKEEIDKNVAVFLEFVDDSMSDFEVTLKVFESIIELVDYDVVGLNKQKKEEALSADTPDDLRSIYGVFVNRRAVCAGYAKATQYLLNMLGIECTYVTSKTHAWNMVKLEGSYYHLDTTWGDSSDTAGKKSEENVVRYNCFCITTDEVLRLDMHTPDGSLPLPKCNDIKCNYYYRYNLIFDRYNDKKMCAIVKRCLDEGKLSVSVKCRDGKAYGEMRQRLITKNRFREILQYANLRSDKKVDLNCSYTEDDKLLIITFYLKAV